MVKIERRAAKANKGKRVKLADHDAEIDYLTMPPVFCLAHVASGYCITVCEKSDKAKFVEKLRMLSTQTWRELYSGNCHGLGCERIKTLKKAIPPYLPKDTKFIAFRFSGTKAMIGHQEKDVFHIIWFDDDYDVYDHGS